MSKQSYLSRRTIGLNPSLRRSDLHPVLAVGYSSITTCLAIGRFVLNMRGKDKNGAAIGAGSFSMDAASDIPSQDLIYKHFPNECLQRLILSCVTVSKYDVNTAGCRRRHRFDLRKQVVSFPFTHDEIILSY